MKTITLIRMGGDFYTGNEAGDMGNYRLRPTLNDATRCELPLKNGGYIAGDFMYWEKNNTNNTAHACLHWDFTEYGTDQAEKHHGACRFHGFNKYYSDDHAKRLCPTLENIARMLSDVMGEKVTVVISD